MFLMKIAVLQNSVIDSRLRFYILGGTQYAIKNSLMIVKNIYS